MEQFQEYFNNITSRTWLGDKINHLVQSKVTDLYFNTVSSESVILVGKTEKFYFILECFDSEGYKYSNALFHDSLVTLLNSYQKRDSLTQGNNIEEFVDVFLLKYKLSKELKKNPIQKKTFKI